MRTPLIFSLLVFSVFAWAAEEHLELDGSDPTSGLPCHLTLWRGDHASAEAKIGGCTYSFEGKYDRDLPLGNHQYQTAYEFHDTMFYDGDSHYRGAPENWFYNFARVNKYLVGMSVRLNASGAPEEYVLSYSCGDSGQRVETTCWLNH